mgnify:CR=1 FL=1|tara:strand:+ start:216 stop:509 length:294 start_codon:yes stop_codon:yes gene_type:complete
MPFKRKAVVTVGSKDWAVQVPNPPKRATHARMTLDTYFKDNGTPKVATLPIQDFGCFKGVSGDFQYIRMDKHKKVLEEYDGSWYWNGRQVEGIELSE